MSLDTADGSNTRYETEFTLQVQLASDLKSSGWASRWNYDGGQLLAAIERRIPYLANCGRQHRAFQLAGIEHILKYTVLHTKKVYVLFLKDII